MTTKRLLVACVIFLASYHLGLAEIKIDEVKKRGYIKIAMERLNDALADYAKKQGYDSSKDTYLGQQFAKHGISASYPLYRIEIDMRGVVRIYNTQTGHYIPKQNLPRQIRGRISVLENTIGLELKRLELKEKSKPKVEDRLKKEQGLLNDLEREAKAQAEQAAKGLTPESRRFLVDYLRDIASELEKVGAEAMKELREGKVPKIGR